MKKSELEQIIKEEIEAVIAESALQKGFGKIYKYVKRKIKGKPKLGGPHVDKVMSAIPKMKPGEYKPARKILARITNIAADNPNKPIKLNISLINPKISQGIIKPGGDIPDIFGDMNGKFHLDDLEKLQKAVIAAEEKYLSSIGANFRR